MAKAGLANVLSIHSEKKKYIAGHENIENPERIVEEERGWMPSAGILLCM
jgi:hypothetical protein